VSIKTKTASKAAVTAVEGEMTAKAG